MSDDIVSGHAKAVGLDEVALEAATEIWAAMPWGHEFVLSNGAKAKLVEINGIAGRSKPKMVDGKLQMLFDVQIENSNLDHIEFHLTRSGYGGLL